MVKAGAATVTIVVFICSHLEWENGSRGSPGGFCGVGPVGALAQVHKGATGRFPMAEHGQKGGGLPVLFPGSLPGGVARVEAGVVEGVLARHADVVLGGPGGADAAATAAGLKDLMCRYNVPNSHIDQKGAFTHIKLPLTQRVRSHKHNSHRPKGCVHTHKTPVDPKGAFTHIKVSSTQRVRSHT